MARSSSGGRRGGPLLSSFSGLSKGSCIFCSTTRWRRASVSLHRLFAFVQQMNLPVVRQRPPTQRLLPKNCVSQTVRDPQGGPVKGGAGGRGKNAFHTGGLVAVLVAVGFWF